MQHWRQIETAMALAMATQIEWQNSHGIDKGTVE